MTTPAMFDKPPVNDLTLSRHFAAWAREKVSITRYAPVKRVVCDECVWVLHEAGGKGEPPRAATRKCYDVRLRTGHASLWTARSGAGA